MPTPYSRDGARLRTKSLMVRRGQYVATTDADLVQPVCAQCGDRLNDLDGYGVTEAKKYCSPRCRRMARNRRTGRVGAAKPTRWAATLDKARKAGGSEIAVSCESKQTAERLALMFGNKRDFNARYCGSTVFVWFVAASI
jgi:hypothetical protein